LKTGIWTILTQTVLREKTFKNPPRQSGLFGLLVAAVIGSGCLGSESPQFTAAELALQYEVSRLETRQKYEGRELTVQGFVLYGPSSPNQPQTQGSVVIGDRGSPHSQVECWFTEKEAKGFLNVHSGRRVVVRGVFSGEAGAELRFCRLMSAGNEE
jgi:hypothetical protein